MNNPAIKTYPEMNKKIVELLRIGGSNSDLYAAKRIEELETLVRELVGVIDELRRQINECGLDGEMWDVYQRTREVLGDG